MEKDRNKFENERMSEKHSNWGKCIERESILYKQTDDDIRSDFYRDYTRVLHSNSYSRLKHKTQVFFATKNDHVCTRMEHVQHVTSVSYTIANFLGLNTELTQAIALSHDIGHAPFGHAGETTLDEIACRELGCHFWHEQHGLYVVDKVATIMNNNGRYQNLKLTYAVRDGIVSHCGEVDQNGIKPRNGAIDLYRLKNPKEEPRTKSPYTWEACVVKISDKIAYVGRDIEDAKKLKVLNEENLNKLNELIVNISGIKTINNTTMIHGLITDLCKNSSPTSGISFSRPYYELLKEVKQFNIDHIYNAPRIRAYKNYSGQVINTLHSFLSEYAIGSDIERIGYKINNSLKQFPLLMNNFLSWLIKYSDMSSAKKAGSMCENDVIYNIQEEKGRQRAIIDFIAGMTDNFAIKVYEEILAF